jgi:hypothetical protein
VLKEAAELGLSEADVAELHASISDRRAAVSDEHQGIWSDNAAAVDAFLAVDTQWRMIPVFTNKGVFMCAAGLDYAGVRAGLAAAGIALTPEQWNDLRVIEGEAVAALNEAGR